MNPTKSLAELRELLFNIPDIYSQWYFFTKNLLQTVGLEVHASNIELSDAELVPVDSSKHDGCMVHIKLQKLAQKDVDDPYAISIGFPRDTYIRAFFPSVVLFPNDVLKVESIGPNHYRVWLTSEDVTYRPKVEESFLNPDLIKSELINRINSNLRIQNIRSIKRLLESFEVPFPHHLSNEEVWDWLNQQDPIRMWTGLDDLQKLYEFNLAILERNPDIYHICMVDTFKQDILDYMKK
jgi:hypothetical protein